MKSQADNSAGDPEPMAQSMEIHIYINFYYIDTITEGCYKIKGCFTGFSIVLFV